MGNVFSQITFSLLEGFKQVPRYEELAF
jgi:hypothetical protein